MSRILVDGYNLLAQTEFKDRERLISLLARYKKSKHHEITLVFDGTHHGTSTGDHFMEWGIEMIYSPLSVTADDVILEILNKPNSASWIVVSSDRKIQSAAARAQASFITSEEFVQKLQMTSFSKASSNYFPWMEGREDEWEKLPSPKKTSKKLSKKEKQRRRRLQKL